MVEMEPLIARRIRQFTAPQERLGATYVPGEGVHIRLWAPAIKDARIEWRGAAPVSLISDRQGYFTGFFPAARPQDIYVFQCDGHRIADPASRHQPEGVFGPSAVLGDDYNWASNDWKRPPFAEWVLYEIHTGAFSPSHDFAGIIRDLGRLKNLGVTTLEIMPVSPFPGSRNWGYDGVFPHAVQSSYGGPDGLKALVDACHLHGLAIILDVVFNHIGPEGNIVFSCGPYTQPKYSTPWGDALNFDGPGSDHVRRYFLQAAWQWLTEYRFDGLRLDAVQTIFDTSPVSFLEELSRLNARAGEIARHEPVLIAESDMNDSRLIEPVDRNGLGMDAHWADDLHHALHATLTGERNGYYIDYGGPEQIARIYRQGVAYEGDYSPFRKRYHGRSYNGIDKRKLIVQTQNHDQTGNRLKGERLSMLVDDRKLKLAAACVLLSPFTPLLFMGEEFAARNPFLYFVSHRDPDLLETTRASRREEWKSFGWQQEPPDPGAENTFLRSVLHDKNPSPPEEGWLMQSYYKDLIALSKIIRSGDLSVAHDNLSDRIVLTYRQPGDIVISIWLSFCAQETAYSLPAGGSWRCILSSASYRPGEDPAAPEKLPPFSVTVFTNSRSGRGDIR